MATINKEQLTNDFMEKHFFTQADMNNLARYEKTRKEGSMNMFEYMGFMKKWNANGGTKLADWIMEHYGEYLDYLKSIDTSTVKCSDCGTPLGRNAHGIFCPNCKKYINQK